jgi:hypothetical protein
MKTITITLLTAGLLSVAIFVDQETHAYSIMAAQET